MNVSVLYFLYDTYTFPFIFQILNLYFSRIFIYAYFVQCTTFMHFIHSFSQYIFFQIQSKNGLQKFEIAHFFIRILRISHCIIIFRFGSRGLALVFLIFHGCCHSSLGRPMGEYFFYKNGNKETWIRYLFTVNHSSSTTYQPYRTVVAIARK